MDVTISTGSWSDLHAKVRHARMILSTNENTLEPNPHKPIDKNTPAKSSEFSQDELDIHQNTLHLVCEHEDHPLAAARVLSNGIIDHIVFSKNITEDVRTRFLTRTLRDAIIRNIDQEIIIRLQDLKGRTPALIESLQLPKTNNDGFACEYNLACDPSLRLALFDNSVIRLTTEHEFMQHLRLMCHLGKRSLDILSIDLSPARFNRDITQAISKLARYHKNVRIRILVQNTRQLVGFTHPLVNLAQRLPTSISIRKLNEAPERPEQGYAIIDKRRLLYFNDEREAKGFANYEAAAECEHFFESFERMWQYHSEIDPNLVQIHI